MEDVCKHAGKERDSWRGEKRNGRKLPVMFANGLGRKNKSQMYGLNSWGRKDERKNMNRAKEGRRKGRIKQVIRKEGGKMKEWKRKRGKRKQYCRLVSCPTRQNMTH